MQYKKSKKICLVADKHMVFDDRMYWKQALSLKQAGYEVYCVEIGMNQSESISKEGIYTKQIRRKQYLPTLYLNYWAKRMPFLPTEYDDLVTYVKSIDPDLVMMVDLRLIRVLDRLKKNHPQAKFIYDVQEPRDNNLKDITFKDSSLPKFLTNRYADYIQQWEYRESKKFDYIFLVDDGLYHRFQKNVPNIPQEIIYNFTNQKNDRECLSIDERTYDTAYVGGITEIRGAKVALEALRILVNDRPNFKMLYLGRIYEDHFKNEIETFVKENDLEDNFIFKEHVPFDQVTTYLNQIKIGLNPLLDRKAHHEIIQIKLFEYMNFGIPIVTSNFGYMKQYTEDNGVGLTIPPNQPQALADAVLRLMNDRNLWKKFSENGEKAVDEKYSWQKMEAKMLTIFDQLLN